MIAIQAAMHALHRHGPAVISGARSGIRRDFIATTVEAIPGVPFCNPSRCFGAAWRSGRFAHGVGAGLTFLQGAGAVGRKKTGRHLLINRYGFDLPPPVPEKKTQGGAEKTPRDDGTLLGDIDVLQPETCRRARLIVAVCGPLRRS
jgi:hypothetical protein